MSAFDGQEDTRLRDYASRVAIEPDRRKMSDYDETTRICGVTCIAASAKAILVKGGDLDGEMWIPKSVVHDNSEVYDVKHEGDLVVQSWWARKNGL